MPDRGYALLLGLRRHRDWAALRPRAVEAAVDGLRRAYRVVVADIDPDVEGEDQCGSADVEDRNVLARTVASRAAAVVVVGAPGTKGVHSLVRAVDGLLELGVPGGRLVPVVNRAPRGPRQRAEVSRTVGSLVAGLRRGGAVPSPVFVPERRRLDDVIRDGGRLPSSVCAPVGVAVASIIDRVPATGDEPPVEVEPVAVEPGSLGSWAEG